MSDKADDQVRCDVAKEGDNHFGDMQLGTIPHDRRRADQAAQASRLPVTRHRTWNRANP